MDSPDNKPSAPDAELLAGCTAAERAAYRTGKLFEAFSKTRQYWEVVIAEVQAGNRDDQHIGLMAAWVETLGWVLAEFGTDEEVLATCSPEMAEMAKLLYTNASVFYTGVKRGLGEDPGLLACDRPQ